MATEDITVVGHRKHHPSNILYVIVNGQAYSGWTDVRVTRGVDRFPSEFEVTATELFPGEANQIFVKPGQPCQIKIGSDDVITGYIDRYSAGIEPGGHTVRIHGRGRCSDLVDCSAIFDTMQFNNFKIGSLASKLCQPFNITPSLPDGDSDVVPQYSITLTETPYEILEKIASWANFLLLEDTSGNLVISRVGDTMTASGFSQGQNVQAADVSFSTDGRYTLIKPIYQSTEFLSDGGPAPDGSLNIPDVQGAAATDNTFPARADGSPRYRPLLVLSDQNVISANLAGAVAAWEKNRRWGRSQEVRVVTDTWRDSAGKLWSPNSLATVNIPALKLSNVTWLIAEVSFMKGAGGTTAEIKLQPKEAFVPSYEILQPFDWQVGQDIAAQGGASAAPPANPAAR